MYSLASWIRFPVATAAMLLSTLAVAQEFRIDTHVVDNQTNKVLSESLTLFSDGVVYDFMLKGNKEIAILDTTRRQYIALLNPSNKKMWTMNKQDLSSVVASLKTSDRSKREPFFFDPQFATKFNQKTNRLTLASEKLTYTVVTATPKFSAAVQQYREFADWTARLHSTMPGTMPPFARLTLNDALAQRGFIPVTVKLSIKERGKILTKRRHYTSHHLTTWMLNNNDRERIQQAQNALATFEPVRALEYRELASLPARR